MTIVFRRPRNRAILSAFDARGNEIFEQILDLTDYREDGHPLVDDDMYRKRHGIRRRSSARLYGANGELLRVFENVYDAAGDLETAHTRHADGARRTCLSRKPRLRRGATSWARAKRGNPTTNPVCSRKPRLRRRSD